MFATDQDARPVRWILQARASTILDYCARLGVRRRQPSASTADGPFNRACVLFGSARRAGGGEGRSTGRAERRARRGRRARRAYDIGYGGSGLRQRARERIVAPRRHGRQRARAGRSLIRSPNGCLRADRPARRGSQALAGSFAEAPRRPLPLMHVASLNAVKDQPRCSGTRRLSDEDRDPSRRRRRGHPRRPHSGVDRRARDRAQDRFHGFLRNARFGRSSTPRTSRSWARGTRPALWSSSKRP